MLDLWQTITGPNSLRTAFAKVFANGGAGGGDGVSVADFRSRLGPNLVSLCTQLREGTYHPGDCAQFLIPKRSGGTRRLMVPCVRDRVVHTSVTNALTPIFEPLFEDSSFAYRPGRSVRQAVTAIERWRDAGYKHVIEADIKSYFNMVRHDKLLACLEASLQKQAGTVPLLGFLHSEFIHQAEQLGFDGRGLIQGSPLSPLLANLYLDVLDEEMAGHGVRIVRFADDFVILSKKIKRAETALEELREILGSLGLQLNMAKTRLVDFDKGFEFLGYLFVRSLAMKRKPRKVLHGGKARKIANIARAEIQAGEKEKVNPDPEPDILRPARHATGDRVLYVQESGRRLSAGNHTIYVNTPENNEVMALPADRVERIVIARGVEFNRDMLDFCAASNTQLHLVNGHGETMARLITPEDDHPALQFSQAQICADPARAAVLARKIVAARIRNQRTQLFRLNRRQNLESVDLALERMGRNLRKLSGCSHVGQLRGIEGASGALYWPALASLGKNSTAPFKRSRPAKDALNATFNYLTAMLERDVRSALRAAGLHCGFGFLHTPRDYSQAAVYDLMEPFRAPLTEGLAVYLFNANRLRADMFSALENGTIRIESPAQRVIIKGYENAVAKRVNITGKSNRKLGWRLMMKRQATDLAKAYRKNDPDLFQPYLMEA